MITRPGIAGFTMVELVVVISVLAILGAVGFMSYSSYSTSARDTARRNDVATVYANLAKYKTINGAFPMPENYATFTYSGVTLSFQGDAGENIRRSISITRGGKDPKTNEAFIYVRSPRGDKGQIGAFFETPRNETSLSFSSLAQDVYAENYADLFPASFGDKLGIILTKDTLEPFHKSRVGMTVDFSSLIQGDAQIVGTCLSNTESFTSISGLDSINLLECYTSTKGLVLEGSPLTTPVDDSEIKNMFTTGSSWTQNWGLYCDSDTLTVTHLTPRLNTIPSPIDTTSLLGTNWMITPVATGWSNATKGFQQNISMSASIRYSNAANAPNQIQPVKFNNSTGILELYGTNGTEYNSLKRI